MHSRFFFFSTPGVEILVSVTWDLRNKIIKVWKNKNKLIESREVTFKVFLFYVKRN